MKKLFLVLFLFQLFLVPLGLAFEESPSGPLNPGAADFFDPFDSPAAAGLADPLEPVNRAAFWLNDKVYIYLLKPVCLSIPKAVQGKVTEWLASFWSPLRVGPAELNFKFRDAGSEVGRFVLHGVLRVIDRFDPAKTAALNEGNEDFGRLLETFGVGPGIYLVLPVLGPSSLRAATGQIATFYLDPAPFLRNIRDCYRSGGEGDLLAELRSYESIRKSTLDPYLSIRDAYSQQQASERRNDYHSRSTEGDGEIPTRASRSRPRPVLRASAFESNQSGTLAPL